MRTELAIVGIWYDGYYDLWEDFLELKERYWNDCPYPLYIVNQTKDLCFEKKYNATVIHAGDDAEYSKKVQTVVEQIDADYYLILLEDFFFSKELHGAELENVVNFMKNGKINYYCMPMFEFFVAKIGNEGRISDRPQQYMPKDEYTVNCQPSIWKRDFLKKCIGTGNYNAWIFEGIYAMSRDAHKLDFLSQCYYVKSNPLSLMHGALQGQIVPDTAKYYQNEGYLFKNHRSVMDEVAYKRHQFKSKMKSVIPLSLQKVLKKLLNMESVYGRYSREIAIEMKRMNLE